MTRSTASYRRRKLNTRTALPVIRENDIDLDADDVDAQRNVPKVETGVEKAEEIEHHLQAAISASQAAAVGGKVAQIYIPTPDTVQSSIQYDRLYPRVFSQPATYIRFSSTVEDCIGCPYNMTDEDDACLKLVNEKRNASTQCSEDQFEEAMNFFEETAKTKQPFAAVDNPPVVTWEEVENCFDDGFDENMRSCARDIYEHWRVSRLKSGNQSLIPGLKFGTGTDTEDGDPYVCFRRREVRQVRKTRGRDAQSVEKLKKLRKELEEARQLVALVRQREVIKRDHLAAERQLFEQRCNLRQVKRNLPEQYRQGDDELLINQKPQKKKPLDIITSQQRLPATQTRPAQRGDGRSVDADLVLLTDILAEKENEIEREINMKKAQHEKWNEGYVDWTRGPLTPPLEGNAHPGFRTAVPKYLPTPPASASEHSLEFHAETDSPSRKPEETGTVFYASPTSDGPYRNQPSFRRRIGRGGRMIIDRRGMSLQSTEGIDPVILDRFKFDRDDDDDEETPTYLIDPYDIASMRYRAAIAGSALPHPQIPSTRRAQIEATASNSQGLSSGQTPSTAPRNASSE